MTESERRHHGYTTTDPAQDAPPEPSFAERARTLGVQAGEGTLATTLRRHHGFPFASFMPYALDSAGRPIVLISALAVHTQNLCADDRAALLVTEAESRGRNPLGLARVTLIGRLNEVSADEGMEDAGPVRVREFYLARHPDARHWVDYPDFEFRRMEVEEAYYVGGFGVMGWVSGPDYREAEPDPLRDAAPSIIGHMNEDHTDAMLLLARWKGMEGAKDVRMTDVDRLGYRLRIQSEEGVRGLRIAFPSEAREATRVREMIVAQVKQAREALLK